MDADLKILDELQEKIIDNMIKTPYSELVGD